MSQGPAHGKLYLVPAPLDFGCAEQAPLTDVLPQATLHIAAHLQHWICENAKTTRAYFKRLQANASASAAISANANESASENSLKSAPALRDPLSIQELIIQELPREAHKKGDHAGSSGSFDAKPLLVAALPENGGHSIGLCSEAGMPAVADPGSSVVRAAHELGLEVVPLVGPVSLLLALAASGLNGQNFAFVGYLPQDAAERKLRIAQLESMALKTGQTQIFIETPYRNAALLAALLQNLEHNTRLALACGLTLPSASVQCKSAKTWRQQPPALGKDTPVVFAIGR